MKRTSLTILLLFLWASLSFAQNKEGADSLIRLLTANKIQLVEVDGQACRRVEGPARFLHNNTYLICDTAFWNVDREYIDAIGNVQIIQENTLLTGDRLHYIIDRDLAQFRGSLVELKDDKGNSLRTEYLDYNTKDSIGFFYHGASMRDSTGNIIESIEGTYESKKDLFTFVDQVQMFSDSLFFVSDVIKYRTDIETAYFSDNTMGWKNRNCFSSKGGWYNKSNETIFMENNVYGQTEEYELWCDDFFFDRMTNHAILKGHIQVTDTVDGAYIFGNHLDFVDEPRRVTITEEPVFLALVEEDYGVDSVFIVADTLGFHSKRMFEIDTTIVAQAKERKELAMVDPVSNIRKQKASEKKSEDSNEGGLGKKPGRLAGKQLSAAEEEPEPPQVTPPVSDSLAVQDSLAVADSLAVTDSLAVVEAVLVKDTTEINFLEAYRNVKIFKKDNQIKCDSLLYSDLDSMARLFKDPVIWNEIDNQLTADSMQIVMKDGEMKKGLMLGNGFLASFDSGNYYNQIKAPELAGFFKDGEISRFDALGGASMLIYIADSSAVAYANIKECKIISSHLVDGELKRNIYFESISSNIFPIEEMTSENMYLKDFKWRGNERPVDRFALTEVKIRPSMRKETRVSEYYPLFEHTAKYFPGYMDRIMEEITSRETWIWKSSK